MLRFGGSLRVLRRMGCARMFSSNATAEGRTSRHHDFLQNVAKVSIPPQFDALAELLNLQGKELVDPWRREGSNPFLIPLCGWDKDETSKLCYLRWPTQKSEMDLQLVRTTETGVALVSLTTEMYCKRLVAEMAYWGDDEYSSGLEIIKKSGIEYHVEEETFTPFKKMKINEKTAPSSNLERLILDRYLISKIGPFPDCFERIANNFLDYGDNVSAFVTAERATSWFYSYGHIINFQTKLLVKAGRNQEAVESARASMAAPKWTLADSKQELEDAVILAGYSNSAAVGDMHKLRSTDPRTKNIEEDGLNPIQVILDQAAHLMDAVALGVVDGGWEEAREGIAQRYRDSGYEEMADFIMTNNRIKNE